MSTDRLLQALREIIREQLPNYDYMTLWEYRVVSVTSGPPVVLDLQATEDTAKRLPDLTQVTLWPGPSGGVCVPRVGASVRVGFVGGDPTKPYVAGVDPASSPTTVYLPNDAGSPAAARVGDRVHGGYLVITSTGTVYTGGQSTNGYYPATAQGSAAAIADAAALQPPGVVCAFGSLPPTSGGGTITSGSSKVFVS
jgi:hypothetical protein